MHNRLKSRPKFSILWHNIAAIEDSVFHRGAICGIYAKSETILERRTINKYVSNNVKCPSKMASCEFIIY